MTDFLDQISYIITDAFSAEISEIGKILANLGRVQIQTLAQFLRRDCGDFAPVQVVQKAQVYRQPAYNGL
ncbi:hypothetical protein D3C71_1861590 [compost metagenome]